jgi:hypothetical protein
MHTAGSAADRIRAAGYQISEFPSAEFVKGGAAAKSLALARVTFPSHTVAHDSDAQYPKAEADRRMPSIWQIGGRSNVGETGQFRSIDCISI